MYFLKAPTGGRHSPAQVAGLCQKTISQPDHANRRHRFYFLLLHRWRANSLKGKAAQKHEADMGSMPVFALHHYRQKTSANINGLPFPLKRLARQHYFHTFIVMEKE